MNKKLPDNPMAFLLQNQLIKVSPSNHGKDCIASKPGADCACDKCQYYQDCWPDMAPDNEKS